MMGVKKIDGGGGGQIERSCVVDSGGKKMLLLRYFSWRLKSSGDTCVNRNITLKLCFICEKYDKKLLKNTKN